MFQSTRTTTPCSYLSWCSFSVLIASEMLLVSRCSIHQHLSNYPVKYLTLLISVVDYNDWDLSGTQSITESTTLIEFLSTATWRNDVYFTLLLCHSLVHFYDSIIRNLLNFLLYSSVGFYVSYESSLNFITVILKYLILN